MATSVDKRSNDNGFVFKRVRKAAAPITAAPITAAPLTPAKKAAVGNENQAVINGQSARGKRAASSAASPRLDFPEPKRRLGASPAAAGGAVVRELSVPVRRAPQPTPLVPRTRTRIAEPTEPVESTPSAARRRRSAGRRATAVGRKTMGASHRRRSTFSMRGKRASSIGGGFKAMPHESVAAEDFYRHISPELPEPIRLRQLLAWCARREPPPRDAWPAELPDAVRHVLDDALREAVDDVHVALEKGAIATSWYHRPVDQAERAQGAAEEEEPLLPHPENVANREARDRLKARVAALRAEDAAWVRELKRAGAEHARALDRLPKPVQALTRGEELPPRIALRADAEIDWSPLTNASADAASTEEVERTDAVRRYIDEGAAGAVDAEVAAAEEQIDAAVRDIEVSLDAFHLDAHRASEAHAAARDACARVASALGFALVQRRAQTMVRAAAADPNPDDDSTATKEDRDTTRDLLRTLAAALAK
ncbi:hypothetical protein H4R26_005218 [Coemansia thaxteri]|uniref:Kinetochore protein mis13 n=1 Tax=Coemansia thaxteri TaxID=2663907 RepID=A0A9W8ECT2_9FUNG|nr:hypothetical protein H4R26_005218 [Coemansia thaxteri]KAJ2476409.1 hypothetical protein EV174_004942 [Coemansia sp. RSA 2320]